MLKTLDILIGVSLVMLMVSLAVTLLTQALINLQQSRGKHLLRGLSDLLEQIHPGLDRKIAEEVSGAVLKHPLIRGSSRRFGEVIKREELTKLLMEFGSPTAAQVPVSAAATDTIRQILARNGVNDPDATLRNVRMLALELERTNPELANTARHNLALLHEASSEFVAKINAWFDQTMDRVSERFTFSTRILTFISASFVALALQLDTVSLVNRLSMDERMRDAFVRQAMTVQGQQATDPKEDPKLDVYYDFLAKAGVISVPDSWNGWLARWSRINPAGLLLSILLLSLGAPFWYSMLNRLLQLRSAIAEKDDIERRERQSTQAATQTPVGPAAVQPGVLMGERGDMTALG